MCLLVGGIVLTRKPYFYGWKVISKPSRVTQV